MQGAHSKASLTQLMYEWAAYLSHTDVLGYLSVLHRTLYLYKDSVLDSHFFMNTKTRAVHTWVLLIFD